MNHDHWDDPKGTRFDSQNKLCTKVGGIMDHQKGNLGDKSLWTTCSVEDMKSLVYMEPNCLKEFNSQDMVNPLPAFGLAPSECDFKMPDLKGYNFVKLNGEALHALSRYWFGSLKRSAKGKVSIESYLSKTCCSCQGENVFTKEIFVVILRETWHDNPV